MELFVKPDFNLCMEEDLMIPNNPCGQNVTLINKIWGYTGPAGTKLIFINFA